jgi:hypothetical protein
MKKNSIWMFSLALIAMVFTSCHKELEQEPFSSLSPETFYQDEAEAQLALAAVYSDIASDATYGNLVSMNFTNGTDESLYNRTNVNWSVALYLNNSSTIEIEKAWMRFYKGINSANYFIARVGESEIEESAKNRLLGEAYFLRAFYYFDLVRLWGEVPLRTEPITEGSNANNIAKSSISEVYQQIISDLTIAYKTLPNPGTKDAEYGHANRTAAHGLLARVYLTMAGKPMEQQDAYQLAVNHCDSVINTGYHQLLPEYKQVFLNQIQDINDDREMIFEIQFGNLRPQGIREDGRVGNLNGVAIQLPKDDGKGNLNPYAYAFFYPSISLINRFDAANDDRYAWNIANWKVDKKGKVVILKDSNKSNWYPGKFRRVDITSNADGNYSWEKLETGAIDKNFTGINFPYLRYSDILLMKAEALNELGKTGEAVPYMDQVRNRAGLANIDPSLVASKETFFNELMDERMREFCFEGIRKNDLVRWGRLLQNMEVLRKDMMSYGIPEDNWAYRQCNNVEEKHNLLPIPLKEVTINQLLDQSELWRSE